jgi:hypothetical protein
MRIRVIVAVLCGVLSACGGQADTPSAMPSTQASSAAAANARAKAATPAPQRADYTRLFSLTEKDCPFLGAEEMGQALSIPAGNVEVDGCRDVITLADGSKSPLGLHAGAMPVDRIRQEIDSYRKDGSGLLSAEPDASGDNILALHRSRGWLFIYNPQYDHYLRLSFGTTGFATVNKGVTVTDRKTIRENAKRLANALIAKYAR